MKWLHEINLISDRISKVIARPKFATNADRILSEIIVVSFLFVMFMLTFCHVNKSSPK